ncbi:hypothetical protein ACLMJK_002943 [Lecanora helva]
MGSDILPSKLQELIRYALRGSTVTPFYNSAFHSATNEDGSRKDNKQFKELIKGIQFSRRFILSYQLVLVALLVVFTAIHWTSKLRARRRKRSQCAPGGRFVANQTSGLGVSETKGRSIRNDSGSGSSSLSSTLRGDDTPRSKTIEEPGERTALLALHQPSQPLIRKSSLVSNIRGWLVYQPKPIPVFRKTLPSNGESLVIFSFVGLQVFYAFYKVPLSISMLFVFADRTSLLFVANLPLLYLFAAKNQPIKILTGYSYESLNIFHRRLGEIMCLLALLHSLGMTGVWYTVLRPSGVTLAHFLLIRMILLGLGAFVAYELLYFTSLGSFRQKWYELFLGLHVFLQAAALILVWFHHHRSRPYVGVALGIFLIDRLVYRVLLKRSAFMSSLDVQKDGDTVAVRTSISTSQSSSALRSLCGAANIRKGWKTTEHVFLTVPALAPKHIIQAHPFTVASRAPRSDEKEVDMELLIRGQDGFSADLVQYARSHHTVGIRLDGPYGSRSAVSLVHASDHAVLLAGGSGIAVTWPLVCSALETFGNQDLESPNSNTDRGQILFIWVIRQRSHLSWLGIDKLEELQARGVTLVIPPPTAEFGHPDIENLIADWTTTLQGRIGVVVSGPDGLNRCVRNTCVSLIRKGHDVHVEVEKFGW